MSGPSASTIWLEYLRGQYIELNGSPITGTDSNSRARVINFTGGVAGSFDPVSHRATIALSLGSLPAISSGTLVGRGAAGTGAAVEITPAAGLAFTDATHLGIASGGVTLAQLAAMPVGLLGNDAGTATPKVITLGTGLGFVAGALAVTGVAIASLETIADQTFLGNVSGITASPAALTATQITANLNAATTTLKGLVPAPGTATGKFLKDDLTWANPSGSFTNPTNVTDDNKIAYANAGAIGWRAGVTTPIPNGLAFLAETTNQNLRFEHNTIVATGKDSGGVGYQHLVRWGVSGFSDTLILGGGGSANDALGLLFRTRPTTGTHKFEVGTGNAVATISATGATHTSLASTGTVSAAFTITDAAHTALTASTERIAVLFDLAQTKQWATGALTTQRGLRVTAPTLAFVGVSTVTTAATVAISGAPAAGTNATFTQSVALWLEAGGIAYGSSAALTGLNRYAHNSLAMVGRSSTSTDVSLVTWGVTTDQLALGADGAASILMSATTSLSMRLGAAAEWDFSTTQLDAHSNNIVNLLGLNGTRVATGTLGTTLADANETLSVAGGNVYEQITDLTANRSKGLAVTGSPTTGEVISIRRYSTAAFTLTINDEVGNPLYIFPSGQKRMAEFAFNGTKFALVGHMKIA